MTRSGSRLVFLSAIVIGLALCAAAVVAASDHWQVWSGPLDSEQLPTYPAASEFQAYPGGNAPAQVPTQTDAPPGLGVYEGWTGRQVADELIGILESTSQPWAVPPTSYVDSAVIPPHLAVNFALEEEVVSFQSPSDLAVVLAGDFKPATLSLDGPSDHLRYAYLLVLVDTHSGSWRQIVPSDDVQPLLDMLR